MQDAIKKITDDLMLQKASNLIDLQILSSKDEDDVLFEQTKKDKDGNDVKDTITVKMVRESREKTLKDIAEKLAAAQVVSETNQ